MLGHSVVKLLQRLGSSARHPRQQCRVIRTRVKIISHLCGNKRDIGEYNVQSVTSVVCWYTRLPRVSHPRFVCPLRDFLPSVACLCTRLPHFVVCVSVSSGNTLRET